MKTNKSYTKRLKVTKNGKIVARRPGQNHFNSRDNVKSSNSKSRTKLINIPNKAKSRFLVNAR